MYEIKKFDGRKELKEYLKMLPNFPTNTEIVEKTGVSKGSISEIMLGKRTPTKNFMDKFIKGFNLENQTIQEITKPQSNGEGLTLKEFNDYLMKENEFLRAMLLKK